MRFMRLWQPIYSDSGEQRLKNSGLTTAHLYNAVNEIMTNPNAPNCTQLLVNGIIALNDIYEALRAGYSPGSVRQRLRARIHFSHTNYFWSSH